MPARLTGLAPFRTRRDAERVLSEIIADGGRPNEFRIDQDPASGTCVITILEKDGEMIAGTLGA